MNAYYAHKLEDILERTSAQDRRIERMASLKEAREAIETADALGKPTRAMRAILAHAERHGMTYEGAESELTATRRLQAMLNDAYSR